MKTLVRWVNSQFLRLTNLFAHTDDSSEHKLFGLGQFVLLLTLAPFIFNLSLYSIGEPKEVPSHYEYNPDRFEPLPIFLSDKKKQSKPPKPTLRKLKKAQIEQLNKCNRYPLHQFVYPIYCNGLRNTVNKFKRDFNRAKREYAIKFKAYVIALKKKGDYKSKIDKQYKDFDQEQVKPLLREEHLNVKKRSNNSINSMISNSLAGNDWLKITFPLWLLGALLIIPTVLVCFKRQLWGLFIFGLAVPTFNYFVIFPSKMFGLDALAISQITTLLVPQVAFIWFALRGHIRSKSYAYFILLLIALTFLPALTSTDSSYSIMQAQLPILAFIMASCIGRLLVKIVQENAYLFNSLGWKRSLNTLRHSLFLWLPIVLSATPFFYITEIVLPQHVVNQLHQNEILKFNHRHDLLDNALQSSAVKTDDAIYDWYLTTQLIKKNIHNEVGRLENIDLKQTVQQTFDRVVPEALVFDEYKSDAGFIRKEIVEISVDASQNSTNKAYKGLRKKLRKQLSNVAKEHHSAFQKAAKKGKAEAIISIDNLYQQGVDSLLEANHATQGALWSTINYARAAHQLSILIFIFICIKSLMYVFARVSFNRDTGTFVTLGDTAATSQESTKSQITRAGLQYLIPGDAEETLFISRRFQCRGKAPRFTIPQPLHAPIARLFNGAYSMNKVVMAKGDDTVSCTAAQGIEFFEWDLRDGESIVFDFHHFVGMSDSVKISTLISTRISSLLIGRMIYSQATGPGKLILMAKGRAEITDSAGNGGSLPPERLIAMQTNTRLHIDSELDILNIYLSTAYVRPAGGGQVIVDVDSQRGTKTGLISFLKRFILPI